MIKLYLFSLVILFTFQVNAGLLDFLKKSEPEKTESCDSVFCPAIPANVTSANECVKYYLKSWSEAAYTNMYGTIHKTAKLEMKYKRFAELMEKEDLRLGTPISISLIRKLEDSGIKSKWELLIKFPNKRVSERKIVQNFILYKGKYWLLKGGLIPIDYDNL